MNARDRSVGDSGLPPSSLSGLLVAEISPKSDYLILSSRARGGIWDLRTGKAVMSLRGFRGGYVSGDGHLYADFPKYESAERNVAKLNFLTGEIVPGSSWNTRTPTRLDHMFWSSGRQK